VQNIKDAASIVVAASFTVLMISALILPSLATSAFAQDGIHAGVCRNDFNGPCGTNAPPTNPCSNKPGTISWPSSGGCVPAYCPQGGNNEVRGARLNSGECDPNFNSGSGGNNNNNGGGGTGSAGGAGSSATGTGTAGDAAIAAAMAFPIGYVPDISTTYPPGYVGPEGAVPVEPPIGDTLVSSEGAAADAAADAAVEEAAGAVPLVGIALGVFAAGYWIGCGGEFC
jgi:hypothetical protein